jgi:hypothetical protein
MMPSLIEVPEHIPMPHRTREEAAQLLEGLRAAYQSLSSADRGLFKSAVSHLARVQVTQELD